MSRLGATLLIPASLAFIASSMRYAFQESLQDSPREKVVAWVMPQALPVDLPNLLLHPGNPGMAALLGMVWLTLIYHVVRRWLESRQADLPGQGVDDHDLHEHWPLIVGLSAGAVWPWLLQGYPLAALLVSALMTFGLLIAALWGIRIGAEVRRSSSLGFLAGWSMMATFGLLAVLMRDRLHMPQEIAVAVNMLLGTFAAISVQLRLGRRIGFSLALIWGLVGIVAATVINAPAIAAMTLLAIAALALVLVQVTT